MSELVHVKGMAELQKFLNTLPAKIEQNILRGALREGAKVILEEAKQNVPVESGELRDGLKIGTNRKNGRVMARIRTSGKHGYLANWMEFGTKAHAIKVREEDKAVNVRRTLKSGKITRISMSTVNRSLRFGNTFRDAVMHPGVRPKPFMRPALDARTREAVIATGNYIKKRLATKHGLDTSEINLESDDES